MNRIWLASLLLIAPACYADSPFAGTWVVQPELTRFGGRNLGLLVSAGEFKRSSCTTPEQVPADGQAHNISGDPFVQSMAVRITDARHVTVTESAGGRTTWTGTYAVERDGKSMTLDYNDDRAQKSVAATVQFQRVGDPVPGAHLLSGTWAGEKIIKLSPSGLTMQLEDNDNGLRMSASDGRGYDIKFDWTDHPLTGYLDRATVMVGLRTDRILQINRKQNGMLVELTVGTLSDDGNSMRWSLMDWQCQFQTVLALHKQSAAQGS